MTPRFFALPLIALALAVSVTPVRAGLFDDDEARKAILELRDKLHNGLQEIDQKQAERLDALTKRVDQIEERMDALQRGLSTLAEQHDATTADIDKLRGLAEQLGNDISTLRKSQRDLMADYDQRLRKFEPVSVTVDGKTVSVAREEQAAYETAVTRFRANDYRSAIQSLAGFVARYPQSVYAPSAQFWLGSSYYAVKDYANAITAQQTLLERFPDSPHVPEALLNIASCQVELNDTKSARASFAQLINDFPGTEAASLAKERLDGLPAEPKDAKDGKGKDVKAKSKPKN